MRKLRECRRIRGDRNDDLMSLASERELFAQDTLTAGMSPKGGFYFIKMVNIFLCVLIYYNIMCN